jgi:16S rRNA (uracil1498-N3)-methyltransferase
MQLFYCPEIVNGVNSLNNEESIHCIKVLRKNIGDTISLIDGIGFFYKAIILTSSQKKVQFKVQKKWASKLRSYSLHIAIAPTKSNDRFEWFLEKAVEIGVDEITPILCDHSERKFLNMKRMKKILISATKQSMSAKLPLLHPQARFEDFLKQNHSDDGFIAHCSSGLKMSLTSQATTNSLILIGPEGDFSNNEIEQALSYDFKPISLGHFRLRTETAGIVACHTLSLKYENC